MRQAEPLYQPLAERIDTVVWLQAPDREEILYMGPSYERVWGRSRESLYRNPHELTDAIHADDRQRVLAAMREHGGGGLDERFRILTPSRSLRWIRARTFRLSAANAVPERIIGVAEDISEQQQVQEALRVTLNNLRERYIISRRIGAARTAEDVVTALRSLSTLADARRVSVLVFDKPGQDAPPHGLSLLVDWREPAAGTAASDKREEALLLLPLFARSSAAVINDIAQEPRLDDAARTWLSDQETRSLLLFPLITSNEWYGMLVVHLRVNSRLDPNEMNYIEKVINQAAAAIYNFHLLDVETRARREAEDANNTKLRFLAMVSHELRTPLTAIKGFATTLLADDVVWDPDSQRDFLETISDEADKLTDLIEHLLDVSRLESGTLRIEREKRDLRSIIDAARPRLESLAAQHQLVIAVFDDLPPLKVDPQRVTQVLTNLISNAAKYAPAGTRITVSARHQGEYVQIDVRDEGPGIPADKRTRVFEPFYSDPGRESSGERARGVGLGLSICKGLVEEHGGRIWVQDDSGTGATLSFTLPVAPRREAAAG